MKQVKRWQDAVPSVIGVLLLLTPLAFSLAMVGDPSLSAWILSAVIGVSAVVLAFFWLGIPGKHWTEGATMLLGLVLFISPWVLGKPLLTVGTLASASMGLALLLAAGAIVLETRAQKHYQAAYLYARAYGRRVSNSLEG
jgi:membrane-bound ClpP family serine protease